MLRPRVHTVSTRLVNEFPKHRRSVTELEKYLIFIKKKKKTLPHSYHSKSKCLNVVLSANDDVCMTGEMKQNVSEMCANLNVI